jgi:hypothetical protein
MKSPNMSSIFSSNNSIPLIIFVFIFIGVGMFFLIQKTTEKEQNKKARQNSKYNVKSSNANLEQKIIEESQNQSNPSTQNNNNNNNSANTTNGAFSDNISNPFSDEVGLFIQRDNDTSNSGNKLNINKYAKPQPYIPPFGSGKETRCVERQVNRPHNTDSVQSTGASNLVKYSSDASY